MAASGSNKLAWQYQNSVNGGGSENNIESGGEAKLAAAWRQNDIRRQASGMA